MWKYIACSHKKCLLCYLLTISIQKFSVSFIILGHLISNWTCRLTINNISDKNSTNVFRDTIDDSPSGPSQSLVCYEYNLTASLMKGANHARDQSTSLRLSNTSPLPSHMTHPCMEDGFHLFQMIKQLCREWNAQKRKLNSTKDTPTMPWIVSKVSKCMCDVCSHKLYLWVINVLLSSSVFNSSQQFCFCLKFLFW